MYVYIYIYTYTYIYTCLFGTKALATALSRFVIDGPFSNTDDFPLFMADIEGVTAPKIRINHSIDVYIMIFIYSINVQI
jgi:hypothetical protein